MERKEINLRTECDQCLIRQVNRGADIFCPSCCDFLCQACKITHKHAFGDHRVITHDFDQCRSYVKLKMQINATNIELAQTHNDAERNIDLAERYKNKAFEDIQAERDNINKMFDEQRAKINSELDELEKDIKEVIIDKFTTDCEKLTYVMKETEVLKTDIQGLTDSLDSVQQPAFFDSMKQCQQQLATQKPNVKQAEAKTALTKYRFEPNWQQHTVTMAVTNLGTIQTLDSLRSSAAVRFICDINVYTPTDTEFCNIKGLCLLSRHVVVAADTQNKALKIIDIIQNKLLSVVAMPTGPRDVTKVKDDQVAVTLPSSRMIRLLNLSDPNTPSKIHDINVNGSCRGIIYFNEKLVVSFDFPTCNIQIIDMNGQVLEIFQHGHSVKNLESRSSFAGICLSSDQEMIYIADEDRNTVTGMTTTGKVKAVYRDTYFERPRALSVDRNGFVYATGKGKVHQLSSDLSHGRIVLDHSHGIHSVQCLLHCQHENAMYIGMIGKNKIKKFQIL